MRETVGWLKTVYDKLLLFVVLFCLLLSVVLLSVFVDSEKKSLGEARWEQPIGPQKDAKPLDMTFLNESIDRTTNSFQISDWTNRMMVAELRVSCVACGRPISYNAEVCPFRNCGALQPQPPNPDKIDSDLDGMPDKWEKTYGLNHLNPDDAHKDSDNDGFTNLEEFNFGTDSSDKTDAPPPVAKLRLLKVGRLPMPLSFQSVLRPTEQDMMFVLKNKKTGRDYYVKIGGHVEGYEVVGFEEKAVKVQDRTILGSVEENISILTLRKNNKDIYLTIGRYDNQGEMAAKIVFLIDNSQYVVMTDDVITLKKNRYKVVDIKQDSVIVTDELTGKKTSIEPYSEAEER